MALATLACGTIYRSLGVEGFAIMSLLAAIGVAIAVFAIGFGSRPGGAAMAREGAAVFISSRRANVLREASDKLQAIGKADCLLYIEKGAQKAFGPRAEVIKFLQSGMDQAPAAAKQPTVPPTVRAPSAAANGQATAGQTSTGPTAPPSRWPRSRSS